ncbi:MAG: NUDIX domain-containing protein [Oscillospiraceae bacterium]|nr:NUDIX domain-containing protein [Oscillospiraceae bacterium]
MNDNFPDDYDINNYERPSVAADIAVFAVDEEKSDSPRKSSVKKLKLMLIKRGIEPFRNMWALPGGFLKMNETIEQCACRELTEETGLKNVCPEQFRTYSGIDRDPRGRIISCAYTCLMSQITENCYARTDALKAQWFDCIITDDEGNYHVSLISSDEKIDFSFTSDGKRSYISESYGRFAFDHMQIIADALNSLMMRLDTTDCIFHLLDEQFSIPQMQAVYGLIAGHPVSKEVIHRLFDQKIVKTDTSQETGQHKRAVLYRKKI